MSRPVDVRFSVKGGGMTPESVALAIRYAEHVMKSPALAARFRRYAELMGWQLPRSDIDPERATAYTPDGQPGGIPGGGQ